MSKTNSDNMTDSKLKIAMAILFILGIGLVTWYFYAKSKKTTEGFNNTCIKDTQLFTVNDEWMIGIYNKGETAKVQYGFFDCNSLKANDHVLFKFSPNIEPVVRILYGLPGDKYQVNPVSGSKERWTITINGKMLMYQEEPYYIISNSVPPLRTYEISRQGILRDNEYILFSSQPPGLSDSSNFGLILKNQIVGRVSQ